jgi:hypothetical protein
MKSPLSRNDDRLTHALLSHGSIRVFCYGKQMRLQVSPPSPAICLDDLWTIKSNTLKRIDGDQDNAAISVYAVLGVTISYSVQHYNKYV